MQRLANHAGLLAGNEEASRSQSLSYDLWLADRQATPPNFMLIDDVIQCLTSLNHELNGPDPNTRLGPRLNPIPEPVVYSVACVLNDCMMYYRKWLANGHQSEEILRVLLAGTHKITFCWMQLLASDISELAEGFDLD